ncbi:hypothetical protein VP01_1932g5 [Puccinia sorghi]|uniref:Uncharacterized protein n=1 Tax=Puccinia sorghi TaxID=27349 RepID=A0A0L6VCG3_9BASI|nr:hypothetical protein VP01_1932g5 [Puccinia sorghi]
MVVMQDGSNSVDFKDLDIYTEEIYKKYGMNKDCDQIHPWAKKLISGFFHLGSFKDDLVSPPANIEFLTKRKESPMKAPTGSILELTKWLVNQINLSHHKRSTPPSSKYNLRALGFNIGFISKLCNNVSKYKAHLLTNKIG